MPLSKSEASTGPDVCRGMAHGTLDAFISELARANEAGHALSIEVIRALADQFKKDRASSAYIVRFDQCQSIRDQEIWDKTRRQPFDRMVVTRFSHLFPPEGQLNENPDFVSRRILPGLFTAMEKMAGEEQFDGCRLACKTALTDAESRQGGRLRWQDFYESESANELVDDLLISMVHHFENLHKRTIWMGDLINSDLSSFDDYAFESLNGRNWTIDHHGALNVLRALYHRFDQKMGVESSRAHLLQRYGADSLQQLITFLQGLRAAQ